MVFYDYTTLQIKLRYSSHITARFRIVDLNMCQKGRDYYALLNTLSITLDIWLAI